MPRNYDAQGRPVENTLTNPIGSVSDSTTYREGSNSGTTWTDSKGRHTGQYSKNNPYFDQMRLAQDKQDIDALYELAIQWEADYANRQMQLEENRAILEEQRQYDSPVEQIARQRAAGINPDLEGSSGGSSSSGSSAQLANPGMADQTGQTKFSNQYDNAHLVFEGINTASNLVGALAGGVSGIMNAVSNMKILPSQILLNEANAGLSSAKANEITELLAGKKEGVRLSNIAQGIQNSTATLQQLALFADLIDPNTPDMAPHLTALGIPEAQIPAYTDMIKQMHANPKMREQYAKAEVGAKWSEAENALYTDAVVAEMTDLGYKIQYEQQYWSFNTSQLKNKISALLNTDEVAGQSASNELEKLRLEGAAVGLSQGEVDLRVKQLKHDTAAYLRALKDHAEVLKTIEDNITALGNAENSDSPNVKAILNRLRTEKLAMRGMLANEFNQIKTHYMLATQNAYYYGTVLDENGEIKEEGEVAKYNYFSDLIFNDLVYHRRTPDEIANQWVNTAIDAVGVAVDAANVGRGFGFNRTYRDVHNNREFNRGQAIGYDKAKQKYGIR